MKHLTRRGAAALLLMALALGACSVANVETPDPAAVPSGPLASPADATGPIVELGGNVMEGLGWRSAIYPSGDAWCLQIETAAVTTADCGDLPAEGEAFGTYRSGTDVGGGVTAIEGLVNDEVVTVWVILESGARTPALMQSLAGAGIGGQAFVRLVPPGLTITHLQAVALNGEVLDTIELTAP